MRRLAVLEQALERRSRRLRGFRLAGFSFAAAVAALAAFAVGRAFGLWPDVTPFAPLWLAAVPFLAAGVAYLVGRAPRPNVPLLLLRVDLALGTGERLSALRELRETGRARPFRRRIEQALEGAPLRWRKALPLGFVSILVPTLAAVGLAGAGFLLWLESPPLEMVEVRSVATSGPATPLADARAREPAPGPLPTERRDETLPASPPPSAAMPSQTLDDVLGGVSGSPGSEATLSESPADLQDLAQGETQSSQSLSDVLSQIQERLREEPGPLTPEEREALSQLLNQTPDQSLRQAIKGILDETSPENLGDDVAQAQVLSEGDGPESASSSQEETASPSPSAGEGERSAWGSAGERDPEEGPSEDESSAASGAESSADSNATPGEEKDEALTGGDETAPSTTSLDSAAAQNPAAAFVPEDLAGLVGDRGEFEDFLTKGVPLETLPGPEAGAPRLAFDPEALRAALAGRPLPPGTEESVRLYFESITQGGP